MANLLNLGQKGPGTVLSDAFEIPPAWEGSNATVTIGVPSNQNTSGRSVWFYIERSDSEAGPWSQYGGLHWQGGNTPGKDGTWSPGKTFAITPDKVGWWVRGRMELPARMRCGIDIDLSN